MIKLDEEFFPHFDDENSPKWAMCPKCFRTDAFDWRSRTPQVCADCDTPMMVGCMDCDRVFKTKPKKKCACGFDFKTEWREAFIKYITISCLDLAGESGEGFEGILKHGSLRFPVFSTCCIEKDEEYILLLRKYELDSLALKGIENAKKMLEGNDRE